MLHPRRRMTRGIHEVNLFHRAALASAQPGT
jgi:hypothetical protein